MPEISVFPSVMDIGITVTKSDVPKLREIVNEVGTSLADSLKPIEYQPAEKPKSTVRTSEIIGNTPYKKISLLLMLRQLFN